MKRPTARRLAKLYPAAWRERFEDEFLELLESRPLDLPTVLDVLGAALTERLLNPSGLETNVMMTYRADIIALAKRPSGFVPLLMSLAALATVAASVSTAGVARQPDEGAAAHIFQLLIVGELPFLAFFIVRWLRTNARATLSMIAIQVAAIALAILPVWLLHL